MPPLEEPLLESAPLAKWIAERLCPVDRATGKSCAWHHGHWQHLRLMGLATTPRYHADFYLDALARAPARNRRVRVLISGTMDYSMLAHVLWACGEQGLSADVTIVDICDTPLFLNYWYARRAGLHVRGHRADILSFEADSDFDVVCTHALLGQISPDRRQGLMSAWRRLLKPGGLAVTVNRIRPGSGSGAIRPTPQQARALREAILREAGKWRESLGIDPEELARGAERNALEERTYPVSSRDEFVALFEAAGFAIDQLSYAALAAGNATTVSGPRIPDGAEYGRVVARRA